MKYVYLIRVEGTDIYKIGYTKSNPELRLKSLQTGNPLKLELINSYQTIRATKIEATLHKRYESSKVTEDEINLQGEWFRFDINVVKNFKTICESIDNNFKIIEENSTLFN